MPGSVGVYVRGHKPGAHTVASGAGSPEKRVGYRGWVFVGCTLSPVGPHVPHRRAMAVPPKPTAAAPQPLSSRR